MKQQVLVNYSKNSQEAPFLLFILQPERSRFEYVMLPLFTRVINRVDVIFDGAEPIMQPEIQQTKEEILNDEV